MPISTRSAGSSQSTLRNCRGRWVRHERPAMVTERPHIAPGTVMTAFDSSEDVAIDLGTHRTIAASSGTSDGPVLCCLHSLGVDRRAFAGFARELAPGWRL